jgi:general nucleoside transport system permease protein
MKKFDKERVLLALAGPVIALVLAIALTSIVLLASNRNPFEPYVLMLQQLPYSDIQVLIINQAAMYYIAAIAVALGFRMNLFNIGVDGQYRLATLFAGAIGAASFVQWMPGFLKIIVIVLTAMLVGALWAGIAGLLKVTRGVSEVISTIMLNFIATGLIAYLMRPSNLGVRSGANDITTKPIPKSGQVPGVNLISSAGTKVYGLIFLAIAMGVLFHVIVNHTRFGFDLRATGRSSSAAQASGVSVKKMIVITLLLSGAVAGLVGMPALLGDSHSYSSITFQTGLGFTGIAIALLGRNNPVGIAFAAVLWAFLDQSAQILDINNIPKEIVQITQGVVVLSVVIAYELVRRAALARQQRRVGRALAAPAIDMEGAPA